MPSSAAMLLHAGQLVARRRCARARCPVRARGVRRRAAARGDQARPRCRRAQQHQAQAVLHVEGLGFAAVGVVQQAAVGQRAVDVEARPGGCAAARSQRRRRDSRRWKLVDRHQTTRARNRSWMLSAPTTRLLVIDHQQGVDLVGFHQLRGLHRQRVGVDGASACASSPSAMRRAAQVDVGIVQACGAGRRRCTGRAGGRRRRRPRSCPGACGSFPPALR